DGDIDTTPVVNAPTVFEYLELAEAGGFPEAIPLPRALRQSWLDGYVTQLVGRDIAELAELRSPQSFLRLLEAVAAHTAGVPTQSTLNEAAGASHQTVTRYLDLLEELCIVDRLPAWSSNRHSRL